MNKEDMMKFVIRFYESKWNGKRMSTGRQVKQKTIYTDDWDKADVVAHKMWAEEVGPEFEMSLTRVR